MQLEGRLIGLVEDDPIMGESLMQSLSLEGCEVEWWKTGIEAMRGLRVVNPDVVICDIRLPDMEGQVLFHQLSESLQLPPFLFITAFGDIDQAVSLMREGAADYVSKPFDIGQVIGRVKSIIQRNVVLKPGAVLGASPEMLQVEATLRRIGDLTSPVLLTGETGVGKEVCARFLHGISTRSKEPFVAVNCAAIPADVMERELFGYRGAANQSYHRGFAERARGGILFLDEVGELPLPLQAKLLRLVETREYHRLGGEQLMVFHGRIVCSTNRDLVSLVKQGRFREDFFYRIAGMTIDVPPLRERQADIRWLIDLYFEQFKGQDHPALKGIGLRTMEMALAHSWPGNVREMRNRMERAVALARAEWILPGDLFPDLSELPRTASSSAAEKSFATLSETRDEAERQQIERALRETGGHIIEAARLLGVSRTTLWEKMKRLAIPGDDR